MPCSATVASPSVRVSSPMLSSASATARSWGSVTFRLRPSPATSATVPPAASTSVASSVASAPAAWAARRTAGPECLRRLHRHKLSTINRAAVAAPDRVGQVDHGNGRVGAVAHGLNHPHEHRVASQRPSAVVNEHDFGVTGHDAQTATHRVGAQHPADGHDDPATTASSSDRRRPGVLADGPLLGQHHHHSLAAAGGPLHSPVDHAPITERLELLGAPEAVALPGRHHDGPHRSLRGIVGLAIGCAHRY